MLNRTTRTRLHIRSIKEAAKDAPAPVAPGRGSLHPEAIDHEIGELFREMRHATGLSQHEIAGKFHAAPQTISLLEQGHLSALPPWNETSQLIVGYTGMLGLDSEPVLRRVMLQLPGNHPKRPPTQEFEPSYDNMRANADAIMNRVPGSQTPVENPSLSMQHERSAGGHQAHENAGYNGRPHAGSPSGFSPGYGEMRATPQSFSPHQGQSHVPLVAKKRKSGVFVPFVQLLLLLIILGTGYMMWLGVNDPQGFEDVKSQALAAWETLEQRFQELRRP